MAALNIGIQTGLGLLMAFVGYRLGLGKGPA
jgi:hypothetical protein